MTEEEVLIRRAQSGDRESFGVLYRAYVQLVYRYLLLRLSNPLTAEDITADVFVRAVDGLAGYSARGLPFGAWLFRIARDRLVDYYRHSARRPTHDLEESLSSDTPGPDAAAEAGEVRAALRAALKRLPEEQRDVIYLRYMEGWSLEETGQAMNKTVNAVKALQHRALNALNRLMRDSGAAGLDD